MKRKIENDEELLVSNKLAIRQETYSILRNLLRQNGFKEEGESESRTILDKRKAQKINRHLTIFRSDKKVESNQRKEKKKRLLTTAIHNAGFMGFFKFSFSVLYLFTVESDVH